MADLREALESAFTDKENEAVKSTVQSEDAAVESDAPALSDTGVEGDRSGVADDKPASITEVAAKPVTEKEPVADKTPVNRIDRAPQAWKGDAKKVWAELPIGVRQEVQRRELDIQRTLSETALDRKKVAEVTDLLAPHMERVSTSYGGNPMAAIGNMLQFDQVMHSGSPATKAEQVATLIKHFQIDIEMLDTLLSGQQLAPQEQQQSQLEKMLEQRLAPIQQFLTRQQQMDQQQAQQVAAETALTIDEMASDPQFPYFNEVRGEMADIIEINANRGVVISLEDAYNKAVRMNDGVSSATTVRTNTGAATNAALAAHQAAQRAKGAASSVSGSPTGVAPLTTKHDPNDLRGTIESLLSGQGGSRI